MGLHFCKKCGRNMDEREFYLSRNIEKYPPDGRLDMCKKCLTMHVDNWDPETYMWILEEIDVPYIKEEWDRILEKWVDNPGELTGMTILGRYLAKMRIVQYKNKRFADTEAMAQKRLADKVVQMQVQGMSEEEIEEILKRDTTPPKPKTLEKLLKATNPPGATPQPLVEDTMVDDSEIAGTLSEERKRELKMKWGRSYRYDELITMENLYEDMMNSYDIQGAGHRDTLIMICKASLKANQCIDAGDIDGFQKVQKAYDNLMKSGKFQAVQNKTENGEAVDSVGELVAMCEKDGFIPRYYADKPKDKIDRIIQDMQYYTTDLVTKELGLESLIQNSLRDLEAERASIRAAGETGEDLEKQYEDDLFNYDKNALDDQDLKDFEEFESEWEEEDQDGD